MRNISDKQDLRLYYSLLRMYEASARKRGPKPGPVAVVVVELKQMIREYTHRAPADRRCIDDDPYGYYTMLIEAPEHVVTRSDAEEWFHECEEMQYIPSQYDCTGQHFTVWYKLVKRRGRWYCYHRVGVDI